MYILIIVYCAITAVTAFVGTIFTYEELRGNPHMWSKFAGIVIVAVVAMFWPLIAARSLLGALWRRPSPMIADGHAT